MSVKPLKVVLYWHMHQPEYRNLDDGCYELPWTYLHAVKDYVDMAAHLEAVPDARAVVNFTPVLLEQIADYARQIKSFLADNTSISDPLLAALANIQLPGSPEDRLAIVTDCLRANEERLINRFPAYKTLADFAVSVEEHAEAASYINDQYLADLLVWYHLAWLAEHVRRTDIRVKRLMDKEKKYSFEDRQELVEIIGESMSSVITRYRRLAEKGQIEISMTPYAHPIMPLLLNLNSAREALPHSPLPQLEQYPGGEDRVRWHLSHGINVFQHYFGFVPVGCWPSEGSLCKQTLKILSENGFRWTASGGQVLVNSLHKSSQTRQDIEEICLQRPYRLKDTDIRCFFRDDGLSDLIGFTYSDWHADDAVANLVHHLENIAKTCENIPDSVVSIILDGENAWEHYPENGYYFLKALYTELAAHPELELTTYKDCLDKHNTTALLSGFVAGSWVYGNFSTWIGDADKNHGWDMLGDAKRCFDQVVNSERLDEEQLCQAQQQLAICEGSDWFWWFGDYNPEKSVSKFEHLYRSHLTNLYRLLGEAPPEYLSKVFTHGQGEPAMAGTMRPGVASGSD